MKRALAERAKQHHGDVGGSGGGAQAPHRKAPKNSASSTPHVPRRKLQSPVPSPASAGVGRRPPATRPNASLPVPPLSSVKAETVASAPPQSSSPRPSSRASSRTPPPDAARSEPSRTSSSAAAASKRRRTSQPQEDSSGPSSSRKRERQQQQQQQRRRTPAAHASVVPSSDEDDDEEKKDAFYLRHQNRALASELRQYKRSIDRLEDEREFRRSKCQEARRGVDLLGEIWRELEAGVAVVASDAASSQWNSVKQEARSAHLDGPGSTGAGGDVEMVSGLLGAIARLAETPPLLKSDGQSARIKSSSAALPQVKIEEGADDGTAADALEDAAELGAMAEAAASLSRRAEALRASMLGVLRRVLNSDSEAASTALKEEDDDDDDEDGPLNAVALHRQIASLEGRCGELDAQIEELTKARDDAAASEKRVRRGLYRLASGRMKIADVLEVVEKEDGMSLFEEFADEEDQAGAPMSSALTATSATAVPADSAVAGAAGKGTSTGGDEMIDSADVLLLQKRLQDLEEIAASREKRIAELISERDDHLKRINDLTLSHAETNSEASLSTDEVRRSSLYAETASKLTTAERKLRDLKAEADDIRKRWATTKGDLALTRDTMAEMEEKHVRRLQELATTGISTASDGKDAGEGTVGEPTMNGTASGRTSPMSDGAKRSDDGDGSKHFLSDAMRVIELEHKLKQALESVRQAETFRVSLNEAKMMTEALQTKLEELKLKNATLVADKAAARASLDSSSSSAAHASPHKSKDESRANSSSSMERLQKDHRKIRKELAAAVASKDSAKAKQDRAERERDSWMKTNARLLKQSAEKDDMNAKSLSTILHLKQLTEQLSQEKDILEKRVKGAEQVALAARLAANAKERVHEESMREKESAEEENKKMKEKLESLETEKEEIDGRLSHSKAQMVALAKDLGTVRQRCDELTAESKAEAEEKTRLMDALAVAKRDAADATKKAAAAAVAANVSSGDRSKGSSNSEFTMEQMETQVKVLKSRLACNVCNERDKQVILTRCRHMFCRQCVDKNIKNRSRKCPGCGQRFDMKDVGDVWL